MKDVMKNLHVSACQVCEVQYGTYRAYKMPKCSICGLDTCPACCYAYAHKRGFYISNAVKDEAHKENFMDDDLEWDIARLKETIFEYDLEWDVFCRVCDTFDGGYPQVCKKCFSVRTIEILRRYPMDDLGLLVNATLLPTSAVREILSTG